MYAVAAGLIKVPNYPSSQDQSIGYKCTNFDFRTATLAKLRVKSKNLKIPGRLFYVLLLLLPPPSISYISTLP